MAPFDLDATLPGSTALQVHGIDGSGFNEPSLTRMPWRGSDATAAGRRRVGLHPADLTCASGARTSPMQRIYELRYQVYSIECGFLDADDYPEGRESDPYDAESAHFCVEDASSDILGYARIVPGSNSSQSFPWEEHCRRLFEGVALPPAAESGEISRLMVRGDLRRLKLTAPAARSDTRPGDRRQEASTVLLSLYRQMYRHSLASGIRYWYAAMERPLARLLSRMNFAFRQIGEEADYYGPVAPYLADLREIEARLGHAHPGLLAWLQKPDVADS